MIVLRRPIGVHSLLEDYMFKNVRSIWNTWNLNWYIGSFIFSVLTILLIPFWIYMIAMDFWEWFKFHAANQEKKRIQESEYYKLNKNVIKVFEENPSELLENWSYFIYGRPTYSEIKNKQQM